MKRAKAQGELHQVPTILLYGHVTKLVVNIRSHSYWPNIFLAACGMTPSRFGDLLYTHANTPDNGRVPTGSKADGTCNLDT